MRSTSLKSAVPPTPPRRTQSSVEPTQGFPASHGPGARHRKTRLRDVEGEAVHLLVAQASGTPHSVPRFRLVSHHFYTISILLALDRALKLSVLKGLTEGWSFFDFFPRLTLHRNYGVAFDLAAPQWLIILVASLLLIVLILWLIRIWSRHQNIRAALLFIIAGAASNLFDRVVYGFVIDTIEILPRSIWNIADIMIVIGILRVLIVKRKA